MELLLDPAARPFAVAAAVLVGLVLIELATLLLGQSLVAGLDGALDLDGAPGGIGGALGWLNAGGAPLLVVLMAFLGAFAGLGFLVQSAASAVAGPLPAAVASLAAIAGALPLTRAATRTLARIVPRDETYAVALESLIGRVGEVTLGPLDAGPPGRVRVRDAHGNSHFVRARAGRGAGPLPQGASALLVSLKDGVFDAIDPGPELAGPHRTEDLAP